MIRTALRTIALVALLLPAGFAFAAGGSSSPPPPAPAADPMVEAAGHYNTGVRHRNKAWKLEESLATLDAAKREKSEKKIAKAWKSAEKSYRDAIGLNARYHEAWSDLGYVLRHTGRHAEALEAYNQALTLSPTYGPAIEYRGEAYLGLNRPEDAKQAYMTLFGQDRALADELMAAMKAWLEKRQADPAGVDASVLEGFAAWLAEREQVAAQIPNHQEQQARVW